jgi:2-(1,2-epoxy-1,2-dihydrophenyl)acetyl-CoA isomerase
VLLTGSGRGFCAGQDLSEVLPQGDGPMPDISETVRASYNPIIKAIRHLEKPVICAVNGVAAGAGANLAFACDLTIAAEEATFVESFAKLGLIPDTSGTFFEVALHLAKQLATQATRGFGLTKRAMNASWTNDVDAQLEVEADCMQEAGRTADYEEGVRAFLEKRKPTYTGA